MFFYPCKKTKPAQTVTAGTGGNIARHNGKTIFRKKIHTITSKHILPVCARKPITKSTKQPCVQVSFHAKIRHSFEISSEFHVIGNHLLYCHISSWRSVSFHSPPC